jgi:predicted transposase/invertase (TIGR01784 family)
LGVVDLETKKRFSEDFEIHFMELPKVCGTTYNTLNNWMRFLKNPSKEEVIAMSDKAIIKALDTLEYLSQDPSQRVKYEARRKYLLDYNTSILSAEERGEQRGIEIGEQRGIEIGEQRGEKLKALEISKSMRKLGLPIEIVKQTTGLSVKEIEKL